MPDHFAGADHRLSGDLAIQADLHHPARLEQSGEHPPTGHRLVHVVQHADRFDHVESLIKRAQPQDVGLTEPQGRAARRSRATGRARQLDPHPLAIGQARQAEIDSQNSGVGVAAGGGKRLLAGAATGDQDVGPLR